MILSNMVICNCQPYPMSSFYPVVKNNKIKNFNCPFCGKRLNVENNSVKSFVLWPNDMDDEIHILRVCENNNIKYKENGITIIVTTTKSIYENLNFNIFEKEN